MDKWKAELRYFVKNKWYMAALIASAVLSYGFVITHQTVGIDDTPYALYFEEGMATIVGRWVMFLVNKVFHIADFAPFITDLAGVVILMAGVTVWCVLLRRILKDRVPMYGYILFSCLFLSNPLISEVYTYYLHNGIATGYLACGVSLCFFLESLERLPYMRDSKRTLGTQLLLWLGSAVGLWIAIGCYESFMIVYLVGVCILLCTARLSDETGLPVLRSIVMAGVIAVVSMVLRSVMINVLTAVYDLEYLKEDAVQRSVSEMIGWMLQPDARGVFTTLIKRILVSYGVFAYAYYPILIYVIAVAAALAAGIIWGIRKKDAWIPLLVLAGIGASYLLVFVEGKITYYRSAQFLPLFSAWGLLLAIYTVHNLIRRRIRLNKWCNRIVCVLLCAVLWNQCVDMNKWFYVDWLKYEDTRNTINQIAHELEQNFDTSKPVIFTGEHMVPESIVEDAFVEYNSEIYLKMLKAVSLFDFHILEKYHQEYGVWVAQTPALSGIDWARRAFDNNTELIKLFAMHGHTLVPYMEEDMYDTIEAETADMPQFPAEGSIVDKGDYIVVHF